MAEGIRIRPKAGVFIPDNKVLTVTDPARPFPEPTNGQRLVDVQPICSECGHQHFAKTYHIVLRAGSAIVSTGVWERLRTASNNPFEMVNTVAEPPAQGIAPWTDKPVELIEKFVMPLKLSRPDNN